MQNDRKLNEKQNQILSNKNILKHSPSKFSSSNASFYSLNNSTFPKDQFARRVRNPSIFYTPKSSRLENDEINNSTEVDENIERKLKFDQEKTIFYPLSNMLFLGKKRKFEKLVAINEINISSKNEKKKLNKNLEIKNEIIFSIDKKNIKIVEIPKFGRESKIYENTPKIKHENISKKTFKQPERPKKETNAKKKNSKDVVQAIVNNIRNAECQIMTRSQYKKLK